MDPLSITIGVLTLLGACIKTGTALKDFYDGAGIADTKVRGLLTDAESFTQVLRLMKDTLEQENIQSSLQSTGHIGNHWNNLSTSIRDGQNTLLQLQETIEKVNKSVSLLDGPRKHLRLKGATDEIAVFQQQIRSYRDTLQLSLQTVILWNQVTFQESTDKILPNLDEIQQAIRRIAFDINDRIASLQNVIESNSSNHQLCSLNNLRNCVKSAASVVSSASTTLGVDHSDRFSVTYESEFGDCFPSEPGETMLRWISSNTVYEFKEERDTESSLSRPKSASGKSLQLLEEDKELDQSDSDGELEAEIIQSLLRRGKDRLASQEFEAAERHFRNCLTRASSNGSAVSLHCVLGSRSEIMTLLLSTYRHQEKWDEAHSLLTEKIALESRGSSKANQGVLADMLILVEVLLKKCAYAEALLYGRRALKSYRKLGSEGTLGVQDSLGLLCQVCKAAGNHDEEDAYGAILSDILQQREPTAKSNTAAVSAGHDPKPTTSPTASTIKREGPVESPSVQNLSSPDALESNNSWLSSGQLTSISATRTHHRESSLSSLGSAGPASPYTTNTSLAAASREDLPALKDSSLSLPTDISASQSPPLKLVRLEDTSEQLKVGNDPQALPTSKSTSSITLTSASDQMSNTRHPQEAVAADGASSSPSPPGKPLRKSKSAMDLFDLGIAKLPAELLQTSKSMVNLHDCDAIFANLDGPEPAETTSVVNNNHDRDAIFACLDEPVPDRTSTRNTIESTKPLGDSTASSAAPLRPEIGRVLTDAGEDVDPILKTLIGMGYPRTEALAALERYDYNLEKAANFLARYVSEMANFRGLQTNHIQSKSASSVSKENHIGVQDPSRFSVTLGSKTAGDSSISTTNPLLSSSFVKSSLPIPFHSLVQPQSTGLSAGSHLNRPGPTTLTTHRSQPGLAEQARSYTKSVSISSGSASDPSTDHHANLSNGERRPKTAQSLQDELLEASHRIKKNWLRNSVDAHFGLDSSSPVELPTDRSIIANDLSTNLSTLPPFQNEETGPSNQANLYELQGASTNDLSTRLAVTFSKILAHRDAIRRKLVISGDAFCGKSSLLSVFSKQGFPKMYPTELETGIAHIKVDIEVDGKHVELGLWDTGGDYNLSGFRLLCYPDSHLVMICFAINSPDSLSNAEELFTKELQNAHSSPRYILVGLKKDLRYDSETIQRLESVHLHPITLEEGQAVSLRIGAARYLECSAKTGEGVKEVFEAATRLSLLPSEKLKMMRSFRRLFGKEKS